MSFCVINKRCLCALLATAGLNYSVDLLFVRQMYSCISIQIVLSRVLASRDVNLFCLVFSEIKSNFHEISRLFSICCRKNYLDVIKYLHHEYPHVSIDNIDYTAMYGYLPFIQWAFDFCSDSQIYDILLYSCKGGQLHVVQWIINKYKFPERVIKGAYDSACTSNNIKILYWFHDNHITQSTKHIRKLLHPVFWLNYSDMVKYLMQYYDINTHLGEYFASACQSDNLNLVMWLDNITEIQLCQYEQAFANSCENNRLKMAKWIKARCQNIRHLMHSNFVNCAKRRNYDVLIWLIKLSSPTDAQYIIQTLYNTKLSRLVPYVVRYFDIDQLSIDESHQDDFDAIVQTIRGQDNSIKSARF